MTDFFNYDINKYSIKDIENLFNLEYPYTLNNFNYKTNDIINVMENSNTQRPQMVLFLKEAKQFIYNKRFINSSNNLAQITNNLLDYNFIQNHTDNQKDYGLTSRIDTEVIFKPKQEYITTFQNDYVTGNLNPLKYPTIKKSILIDTRFRDRIYETESSDFTFTLPIKLKKVVSLQLAAFEFPVTFYGISASYGNNYMNVFITYTTVNVETTKHIIITVPDGNYSSSDLIDTINALLQTCGEAIFSYIIFSIDITSNFSGSGKTIIQTTGDLGSSITNIFLDFNLGPDGEQDSITPITTKIGWSLGFIYSNYSGTTLISEAVPETASIRYIYLVVDDYNNNNNDYFISALGRDSFMNKNILARIPMKGAYYSIMMENDLSLYTIPRTYFGPVDITRIKLQLLDDHGRVLGMNNSNYSIVLNTISIHD